LILAGGARRCAPNVAGRLSDLLMAYPQGAVGAVDQRTDEFALRDSFERPIAVTVVAVRGPAGRAGAEAAVDTAFPVRQCWATASRARAGTGSAARCVIHLCRMLGEASVQRVDLEKICTPPPGQAEGRR
jgi:hypothetical protein